MTEYRLRRPRNYHLRPVWREAFRQLDRLLDDASSSLRRGLAEAESLCDRGNLAVEQRLRELREEHVDLLPGRAGDHVLEAIFGHRPPHLWRLGESGFEAINVFEEDTPSPRSRRGRPGRVENDEQIGRVLSYLSGDGDPHTFTTPLTHRQAAKRMRYSSHEWWKLINEIRRNHGIEIESSKHQEFWVGFMTAPTAKREPGESDCPSCGEPGTIEDLPCWSCGRSADERRNHGRGYPGGSITSKIWKN